jgi:K+-sensing histidine kinase KdpD
VQVVKRQTAYAHALVDDWLEYARLRMGKARLSPERLELGAVIAAAVESVVADIAARSQRIEILLPQTPIHLEADPLRLQQIVVNLLGNASKFSRAGDPIWIRATIEGDEAVIRVEDQGCGIPAASSRCVCPCIRAASPRRARRLTLGEVALKELIDEPVARVELATHLVEERQARAETLGDHLG